MSEALCQGDDDDSKTFSADRMSITVPSSLLFIRYTLNDDDDDCVYFYSSKKLAMNGTERWTGNTRVA